MKIEIQGVTKLYGSLRALDRVWLELEPGQIVALLGPNGAGKTSILRCLCGLSSPDKGEVLYDNQLFQRQRIDLRRQVFYLPDFPFMFADMTLLGHIGMMINIYESSAPGMEDRILEILKDFDLLAVAETPIGYLSRGQMYKAALAALLAVDPAVWLLDEPFASGMDPHGINALKKYARNAARRGKTIIYSTQIVEVAERFSDRVCVIHQGEIRAFDSVETLRRKSGAANDVLERLLEQLHEKEPV